MQHHVIVSFGKDRDFDFKFSANDVAGLSAEAARRWLEREYETLECDVATPVGKILVADRVVCVARYAGEERFRERPDWAGQFAKAAAVVLGRELIRVDVPAQTIGY
jgi:hypothetical protein